MLSSRGRVRRAIVGLALLIGCTVAVVATASPASADTSGLDGCITSTTYEAANPVLGWKTTNTASSWLAGPGDISYSTSSTATSTLGGSLTGGVSFSANAVVLAMEESVSGTVDLSVSTSRTATWNYNIHVLAGQTARAVVSDRGYRANITKIVDNANCTTNTYTGSFRAPFTSFTSATTCIFRDVWPETFFQATSGGCFAES
ncbi:MAG: hypothetical protein ACM30G_14705 [Micromonosporaceae bacterium]